MIKRKLPNIILLVMDTLGAKRMSLYGYHRETTPSLELLAKDCTVYNRCFAPACWTIPSHASMFTGLYPSQHATHEANPILSKNIRHLATVLKMSGYRTYGLSSNGLVAPASGLCPDFDYFVDFGESFDEWMENFSQKMPDNGVGLSSMLADIPSSIEKIKLSIKYLMKTGKSDEFIKEGIGFFNRRLQDATTIDNSSYFSRKTVKIFHKIIESSVVTDDKPFFIFINLMEAHEHYRPPLKWRKYSRWWDRQPFNIGSFYNPNYQKYLSKLPIFRNLYDDEICFLDHIVHNIYNICNNNKLLDETIFIITSDHGEHQGEKNSYEHRFSLYNELIWVPLIIHYPGGYNVAKVDNRLVSLTDLYSTIMDMADIPIPRPPTSISLLGHTRREFALSQIISEKLWIKPSASPRMQFPRDYFSPHAFALITAGGLKIIEKRDGPLEIYDLNRDMDESTDLASKLSPEIYETYRGLMDLHKTETGYTRAVLEAEDNGRDQSGMADGLLEKAV